MTGTPPDHIGDGPAFAPSTPDAASITKFLAIRAGAVTHGVNMSQYLAPLPFAAGSGQLQISRLIRFDLAETADDIHTSAFPDGVLPLCTQAGTSDPWLDSSAPTTSHGTAASWTLNGTPDQVGLVRWNLSSLQAGSHVTSAYVDVWATDGSANSFQAFEILRDWAEAEGTWNLAATGSAWQSTGAQGSTGRGASALGRLTGAAGGLRLTFNAAGLTVLQKWIEQPSSNHGIVLQLLKLLRKNAVMNLAQALPPYDTTVAVPAAGATSAN